MEKIYEKEVVKESYLKTNINIINSVDNCIKYSNNGKILFEEALKLLLIEEKKQRKNDKEENTTYIVLAIAKLCKNFKRWKILEMQIFSIIKRHGQFKKTVQKLIQECISYIKQTPDITSRISFIDTLLTVSEGKIYLELERARLTMQKCQIFEYEKKDLRKAVEIVKDLQVETFNSVKQREKTKYIIEQIRLFLTIQDPGFFLRAKIRINNIKSKTLKIFPDLSLKFHRLNLEVFYKEEEFFKMSQTLLKLRNLIKFNQKEKNYIAIEAVMACVFANYNKEQKKLLLYLKEDKHVQTIEYCKKLLKRFITHELIHWPYDSKLKIFVSNFAFTVKFSKKQNLESIFEFRIIQHNIRTISLYYTYISTKRLSEFLKISSNIMEKFVSEMVVTKNIYASIDRLSNNISFQRKENEEYTIDQWSKQIDKIVHILETTSYQIQKEIMVQKKLKS